MKKVIIASFILIAFLFPSTVSAQVVINEFSSGTSDDDWVEIYNLDTATQSADLSLYRLEDKKGNTNNLSTFLDPGAFKVFTWYNRLDNEGGVVKLVRISGNFVINEVSYGNQGGTCVPSETQSIGRSPDGTGGFVRFSSQTKAATNNSAEAPCPTPTSTETPTDTPTPTQTSTPTPTQTSTQTLTTTLTVKVTKTPTPTIEVEEESDGDEIILGLRDELSPTPELKEETESKKKFPLLAGFFMVAGFGFMGFAGYPFLKKAKKRYNLFSGRKRKPQNDSSEGV